MPQSAPQRAPQAGPYVPAEVRNLAELALVPPTGLPEGFPVWVLDLSRNARIQTSSAALVPNQIIASLTATKRWFVEPANPWTNQLNWGVSPTGNDEAAGTPAAPLATFDEFVRRVGGSLLNGNYNVAFAGAVPGGVNGNSFSLGPQGTLALDFQSAATVVQAGVVGAGGYVAPVPATPEYALIQAGASLAGTARFRIRMTSGDGIGAIAQIGLPAPGALPNTWARISPFYTYNIITNPFGAPIPYGGGPGSINPTDTFVIETLPAVGSVALGATKQVNPITGTNGTIALLNCQIGALGATTSPILKGMPENPLTVFGCQIYPTNVWGDSLTVMGSWLGFGAGGVGTFGVFGARPYFQTLLLGCLCTNTPVLQNANIQDSLCQGCNPDGLQPGVGDNFAIGSVGIFDSVRDAIRIEEFVQNGAFGDIARCFGNGNAQIGMHIMSPGFIVTTPNGTIPRINGTVNDYQIAANPLVAGNWPGVIPVFTNWGSGILDTRP